MFSNWRLRDWILLALVLVVFLLGVALLVTGLAIFDGELKQRVDDGELVRVFEPEAQIDTGQLPPGAPPVPPPPPGAQDDIDKAKETEKQITDALVQGLEYLALTAMFIALAQIVSHVPAFLGICISDTGGRCCVLFVFMLLAIIAILGSVVGAVLNFVGQALIQEACTLLDELFESASCVPCKEDSLDDCITASNVALTTLVQNGGNPFANGTVPTYCFYSEETQELFCDDLVATMLNIFILIVICIIAMVVACCCGCFVCCGRNEDGESYYGYARKEKFAR